MNSIIEMVYLNSNIDMQDTCIWLFSLSTFHSACLKLNKNSNIEQLYYYFDKHRI